MGDPALDRIDVAYNALSPFDRARTMTVSVEVTGYSPLSDRTFQIDWSEYERDRQGRELAVRRFRGIASVAILPPQDDKIAVLNPLGLFFVDFEWTAQL
jgi:type IV secretion system protein VirB5